MKKLILIAVLLSLSACKKPFFRSWQSSFELCESMCAGDGQESSHVLQYSAGTCICDNEEGRRVADGYHMYLNNQCVGENPLEGVDQD